MDLNQEEARMPNAREMERHEQELDQPVARGINTIAVELQEATEAQEQAWNAWSEASNLVRQLETELKEAALNV
jgi:exonuclease VII small subunit